MPRHLPLHRAFLSAITHLSTSFAPASTSKPHSFTFALSHRHHKAGSRAFKMSSLDFCIIQHLRPLMCCWPFAELWLEEPPKRRHKKKESTSKHRKKHSSSKHRSTSKVKVSESLRSVAPSSNPPLGCHGIGGLHVRFGLDMCLTSLDFATYLNLYISFGHSRLAWIFCAIQSIPSADSTSVIHAPIRQRRHLRHGVYRALPRGLQRQSLVFRQ